MFSFKPSHRLHRNGDLEACGVCELNGIIKRSQFKKFAVIDVSHNHWLKLEVLYVKMKIRFRSERNQS